MRICVDLDLNIDSMLDICHCPNIQVMQKHVIDCYHLLVHGYLIRYYHQELLYSLLKHIFYYILCTISMLQIFFLYFFSRIELFSQFYRSPFPAVPPLLHCIIHYFLSAQTLDQHIPNFFLILCQMHTIIRLTFSWSTLSVFLHFEIDKCR